MTVSPCMLARRRWLRATVFASLAAALPAHAAPGELTVLAVPAMQHSLTEVVASFRRETGVAVATEYARPSQFRSKMQGEPPDIILADRSAIDRLQKDARIAIAERVALGRVGLGIGVGRDKPVPDVSSADTLRALLLSAKTILRPDPGDEVWGTQVAALLGQLGVAQEVGPKSKLGTGQNPLAPVAFGDAEIGLHSMLEILRAPSIKLVAPVPAPLQQWTAFDLAVIQDPPNGDAALRLMEFLRGPTARALWQRYGMEAP